MISETAFLIKDVIGQKDLLVLLNQNDDDISSSNIDSHTKQTVIDSLSRSYDDGKFKFEDKYVNTSNEPNHDELCKLEQEFLRNNKDLDLTLNWKPL